MRSTRAAAETGTALVLALVVVSVTTLLGLTLVTLAEQEERMARLQSRGLELRHVASGTAEIARTWFDAPGLERGFAPPREEFNLRLRQGHEFKSGYGTDAERDAPLDSPSLDGSEGAILEGSPESLFALGSADVLHQSFWGRRATPDALLCRGELLDGSAEPLEASACLPSPWLDSVEGTLASGSSLISSGQQAWTSRVKEVRLYRPPLDHDLRERFGWVTVEVTAVQPGRKGRPAAVRKAREVLGRIPWPTIPGPLLSGRRIDVGSATGVHWGAAYATGEGRDGDILLPAEGPPSASVPRSGPGRWEYHETLNPATHLRPRTERETGTVLTELRGSTRNGKAGHFAPPDIGDPWLSFHASRFVLMGDAMGPPTPHPFPVSTSAGPTTQTEPGRLDAGLPDLWSICFQHQSPPPLDLDHLVWRRLARGSRSALLHLTPSGEGWQLEGRGPVRSFSQWINRHDGAPAGLFLFDTVDGLRPTLEGDSNNLGPSAHWEDGVFARGLIIFAASKLTGPDDEGSEILAATPGEPFLDEGIELHDGSGAVDDCLCSSFDENSQSCLSGWIPNVPAGLHRAPCSPAVLRAMDVDVARREAATVHNGKWDTDLDGDGHSDAGAGDSVDGWEQFLASRVEAAMEADAERKRGDPRFHRATATAGDMVFEPYLNLSFGVDGDAGAFRADPLAKGETTLRSPWADDSTEGTERGATTVARDERGALRPLRVHLAGVLYCQGPLEAAALRTHGALLTREGIESDGRSQVWFDESLADGKQPGGLERMPLVYRISVEID